jgi:hypothetical protein
MNYRSFKAIKGPWTQETSKHLKEGVKGNKGVYEGGRGKCTS